MYNNLQYNVLTYRLIYSEMLYHNSCSDSQHKKWKIFLWNSAKKFHSSGAISIRWRGLQKLCPENFPQTAAEQEWQVWQAPCGQVSIIHPSNLCSNLDMLLRNQLMMYLSSNSENNEELKINEKVSVAGTKIYNSNIN